MMGSPTFKFRSTVHGKLKSLAVMNLKTLFMFMLCVELEKNNVACIACAYVLAYNKIKTNINLLIKCNLILELKYQKRE